MRADAQSYPSRLLANALVNVAWRNGPVEDVHAGSTWRYSLDERRVTPTEERTLMRFASDGMALAMTVCFLLAPERAALSEGQRPWPERVLPYLPHSVDANTSEAERISLSFNLMFSSFTATLSKPLW